MLITFLCLLINFHIQNISVRAANLPAHRNVISTQPERVFFIMPFIHTCQKCGVVFNNNFPNAKYCTQECYMNTKRRKEYTNCESCNKIIHKRALNTRFCSQKCFRKGHYEVRNCIYCNTKIKVPNSIINRGNKAGNFCSQLCVNSYRVGNENPNWRGGQVYNSNKKNAALKILRPIIRERDNYTCQKCGLNKKGTILDVHHIIPYRLTQNNELDNLILLCHSCHMKEAKNELKLFK